MLLGLLSCSYEAPTGEWDAPPLLNTIAGEVVYGGDDEPAPTYVLVFDAENPGPPAGTGSPVTFSAVSGRAYDGGDGLLAAPYAVTQLQDGDWLLNALMDVDGDFSPFDGALAGATCGDHVGTYLASLDDTASGVVSVRGGERVDGVSVVIGQRLDFERPVFTLVGGVPEVSIEAAGGPLPLTFRLQASSVLAAFSEELQLDLGPACAPGLPTPYCEGSPACPCDLFTLAPCDTALWVWMVDGDADGIPDAHPDPQLSAQGIRDVWPRVYLEATAELPTFPHRGQDLPERWVGQAYPLALEIGGLLAYGQDLSLLGPVGVPFPAEQLSITFSPVFVHYHRDGAMGEDANGPFDVVDLRLAVPAGFPFGAWAVTLVEFTGQTWTVPNTVGLAPLAMLDGSDPAGQAGALVITP